MGIDIKHYRQAEHYRTLYKVYIIIFLFSNKIVSFVNCALNTFQSDLLTTCALI
jgi:hypothetical protein